MRVVFSPDECDARRGVTAYIRSHIVDVSELLTFLPVLDGLIADGCPSGPVVRPALRPGAVGDASHVVTGDEP